jgi:hypothetical protein
LLSKPGCHLCDDAREVVARVAADLGVGWEEVDITTDEELARRWWELIPVTLVDGRKHSVWHVTETGLRGVLAARS